MASSSRPRPLSREDARALALQLLHDNRALIADTVVQLSNRIRPELAALPHQARFEANQRILALFEDVVRGQDTDALLAVIHEVLELRSTAGVGPANFVSVAHCHPIALRRAFQLKAPTPAQGEAAFDEIEVLLLPLMARFGDILFSVVDDEELTSPGSVWFQSLLRSTQDDSQPVEP